MSTLPSTPSTPSIVVACLGCKSYPCLIGSATQKTHLYYEKPYWFCYNCIGCATVIQTGDSLTISEGELPAYEQPTEASHAADLRLTHIFA
jgi:hypothetical protein